MQVTAEGERTHKPLSSVDYYTRMKKLLGNKYILQLCADSRCNLEDLLEDMLIYS